MKIVLANWLCQLGMRNVHTQSYMMRFANTVIDREYQPVKTFHTAS